MDTKNVLRIATKIALAVAAFGTGKKLMDKAQTDYKQSFGKDRK